MRNLRNTVSETVPVSETVSVPALLAISGSECETRL